MTDQGHEAQRDLLLEIGVEELPARWVRPGLDSMAARARELLEQARLAHGAPVTYGTPRRLALLLPGVAACQADSESWARGPARHTAFDDQGRPTRAAEGFARGQGVNVSELLIRATPAGEYVFAPRREQGRPAREVLPGVLERLIGAIEFPAPMRWGAGDFRFGRPIRWVVALLGPDVLGFEVEGTGVRAGRATRGHRFLAPGEVALAHPGEYVERLRAAFVLVDPAEREAAIREQVAAAAREGGGEALVRPDLLEEVVFLVEWPTTVCGRFEERYLALPPEVLVTSMESHQRYFPLCGGSPRDLRAGFVCVTNAAPDPAGLVRAGHEKVLRARLADAQFFFESDRRVMLADRVPALEKVLFLERLGTLRDRALRLKSLAGALAARLGLGGDAAALAGRAALLCKADLVTSMVVEFPSLQGVMGREYALLGGEDAAVAGAIYEHYLPRFAGDELPRSMVGTVVALADKADAVVGCFLAGIRPTGSEDPYGLRRLGSGIVVILDRLAVPLRVSALLDMAIDNWFNAGPPQGDIALSISPAVRAELEVFMSGRVRALLEDRGFRHDVIDSVLAAGWDDVPGALRRAAALTGLIGRPRELDDVLTVFRRAARLAGAGSAGGGAADDAPGPRTLPGVRPELLAEAAERDLFEAVAARSATALAALKDSDLDGFFGIVAGLRCTVDRFFDEVLVMADDPAVRDNRLALLRAVAGLMSGVADLGRLAVG